MQGAILEEAPKPALKSKVRDFYHARASPAGFFSSFSKISMPESVQQHGIERIKKNFVHYAFYYAIFMAVFNLVFVFVNRLFIIPLIATAVFVVLGSRKISIAGVDITPMYSAIACLVMHLIFCISFKGMTKNYVFFFALNAFTAFVALTHGFFVDPEAKEAAEETV